MAIHAGAVYTFSLRPSHLAVYAALFAGCSPGDQDTLTQWRPSALPETEALDTHAEPLELVEPPAIQMGNNVLLARELIARTSRPTWLHVRFTDGVHTEEIAFSGLTTDHQVPLLGFKAGRTYDLFVTLTAPDGAVLSLDGKQIVTEDLPQPWPQLEVVEISPSEMEPGFTLLSFRAPGRDGTESAVILDKDATVRWVMSFPEPITDLSMLEDGSLLALEGGHIVHYDILGHEIERWVSTTSPNVPDGAQEVDSNGQFHHEVDFLPNGRLLTLGDRTVEVSDYPQSYSNPNLTGEAIIADDEILELDVDGTILARVSMSALLDHRRIGYDSLSMRGDDLDWAHSNAVHWDPVDDAWLISMRHQDAVAKISRSGEIVWILGNHDNWAPSLAPYLLQRTEGVVWPYHQHSAMTTAAGTVLLFDNHNEGAAPYTGNPQLDPRDIASRLVEYRIDGGLVEQTWEFRESSLGRLYSGAMGDADPLPQTGNILGVWGWTEYVDGQSNTSRGLGTRSIHVIEVSHTDPPLVARHLHLFSDSNDQPLGWTCNRAEWIPDLYGVAGPLTL